MMKIKQYLLTPAAGKRLIGKAASAHPAVLHALKHGTVVIVAGTTNGYVAEEILSGLGYKFNRQKFFRGLSLPPAKPVTGQGRLPDESGFPGDVVIVKGSWLKGKTIFDVIDDLREGDVILKGANALDLVRRRAAVLIGHPKAGTIGAAIPAVAGRRVRLIIPVGLEKRIAGDLDAIAVKLNTPAATGARLLPINGEVITELEAIEILSGALAELVAAGGVAGAEGAVWLAVSGTARKMRAAEKLLKSIAGENNFNL